MVNMKREVWDEPIICLNCDEKHDEFVVYHGPKLLLYCSSCMYANGDIDETQVKTDDLDNLKMYKSFLVKEMRAVDEKIAIFFGQTLDNED